MNGVTLNLEQAELRAEFARLNDALAALREDGACRAGVLRADLPSEPNGQARDARMLRRDMAAVTGLYDFWEPRAWALVAEPRPDLLQRLRAMLRSNPDPFREGALVDELKAATALPQVLSIADRAFHAAPKHTSLLRRLRALAGL